MTTAPTSAPRRATTTRAVTINGFGDADVLQLGAFPLPPLEPHQALVRVHAAAVNPIDVGTRAGRVVPADRARSPWCSAGTWPARSCGWATRSMTGDQPTGSSR